MERLDGGKAGGPTSEGPAVLPYAVLEASNTWLFPLVYDELRSIARTHWQRVGKKDVLEATALVHEVYLRLQGQNEIDAGNRSHYLAIAARTLHRVLVDHVRATRVAKRGGRWGRVTLSGELIDPGSEPIDLLTLEKALTTLASKSPRRAQVVELRFFGGLSVEEIARTLGVSPRTIKDDWMVARAFLHRELKAAYGD